VQLRGILGYMEDIFAFQWDLIPGLNYLRNAHTSGRLTKMQATELPFHVAVSSEGNGSFIRIFENKGTNCLNGNITSKDI
jgi:hypothetical protein